MVLQLLQQAYHPNVREQRAAGCTALQFSASATKKHNQLIVALVGLLLKPEVLCSDEHLSLKYTSLRCISCILAAVLYNIQTFDKCGRVENTLEGFQNMLCIFNTVMNGLGEILFFLVSLRGCCISRINLWCVYAEDDFIKKFISIANYSSKCGHSKRLLRVVLGTLTATQVLHLKYSLRRELDDIADVSSDDLRVSITNAQEWVCGVETPHTLKHLARHTITRARSGRSLPCAETLGIPKSLRNI